MKLNAYLATIQYIPDIDRNERLNVGVVLHCPKLEYLEFGFIKNKKRLTSFDDELDIEFFEIYIEGIKNEFKNDIYNQLDIKKEGLLDKLSYNYVNQFQFIIERISVSEDIKTEFENLKKLKLHYDYKKKDRLTAKQKFDVISRNFLETNIKINVVKHGEVFGKFDENLNFDFKIDNTYVKIFEFSNNNYKHLVSQIKVWIYNSKNNLEPNMFFLVIDNVQNEITKNLIHELEKTNKNVFRGYEDSNLISFINQFEN